MDNPKVSFYPLDQGGLDEALLFACRLTEKAVQLGHTVHLLARSEDQLRQLDELLWRFRSDSFLPHQCLTNQDSSATAPVCPVTLGTQEHPPPARDVLINLAEQAGEAVQHFSDIRDIVAADESERVLGRQRYRHYQTRGWAIETKLKSN